MITIEFSDGTAIEEKTIQDTEQSILDAHANGVSVEYIEDSDCNTYSCLWSIKLQKEVQ